MVTSPLAGTVFGPDKKIHHFLRRLSICRQIGPCFSFCPQFPKLQFFGYPTVLSILFGTGRARQRHAILFDVLRRSAYLLASENNAFRKMAPKLLRQYHPTKTTVEFAVIWYLSDYIVIPLVRVKIVVSYLFSTPFKHSRSGNPCSTALYCVSCVCIKQFVKYSQGQTGLGRHSENLQGISKTSCFSCKMKRI